MGAVGETGAPGNEWRTAADWPVPARRHVLLPARGRQALATKPPTRTTSSTTFLADPLHPNEIPGRRFPGAKDARDFEKQAEVRTFTTEVLAEPVEWTGKVRAELYVSSTAQGHRLHRPGQRRLSRRPLDPADGLRPPGALPRGLRAGSASWSRARSTRSRFDVGWTSQVFNRGHRIRVTVASTGAPFYEPNPNTGEPLTLECRPARWWRRTRSTTTAATRRKSSPRWSPGDRAAGRRSILRRVFAIALALIALSGGAAAAEPAADTCGAIDRGLAFLTKDSLAWKETRKCASCHHAPMTIWALSEARSRGFAIDEKALADLTAWAIAKDDRARVYNEPRTSSRSPTPGTPGR